MSTSTLNKTSKTFQLDYLDVYLKLITADGC